MDARSVSWFTSEVVRRATQGRGNSCKTMLLSFPRSGNHLVRYIVESGFGRPTLGARDREERPWAIGLVDTPMFVRLGTIEIFDKKPLMVKRHEVERKCLFTRTVFIYRSPAIAIASHTRTFDETAFEYRLGPLVEQFFRNVRFVLDTDESNRMLLSYEFLKNKDPIQLGRLNRFLGGNSTTKYRMMQALAHSDVALGALRRMPSPGFSMAAGNSYRTERIAAEIESRGFADLNDQIRSMAEVRNQPL